MGSKSFSSGKVKIRDLQEEADREEILPTVPAELCERHRSRNEEADAGGIKYRDGRKHRYPLARPLWNGGSVTNGKPNCDEEDLDFDMRIRSLCGSLMRGVLIKIVFVANMLEFRTEKPTEK